tara:strand:+ start:699 stop:1418 length:720 start_codon:yes stop_codon:yes gene_type:complete
MSDKTDFEWVKKKFEDLVVPSLMKVSNLNKKTVISELWAELFTPRPLSSSMAYLATNRLLITDEKFDDNGDFYSGSEIKLTSVIKPYNEISDRNITSNTINNIMTGMMTEMQENKPAISFEDWPLTNNSYGYPPEIGNGFIAIFRIPDQGYNLGWIIYRGAWILGNVEHIETYEASKGTSFQLQGGDLADKVVLSYEEEPWLDGMLEAIFDQSLLVYGWIPAPSFFQTLNWHKFPSVVL